MANLLITGPWPLGQVALAACRPFPSLPSLDALDQWDQAKQKEDFVFKYMWLAITLSFLFYIPVVLWADTLPMIGMLMIPKTCAYVWTVLIGYRAMKKEIA